MALTQVSTNGVKDGSLLNADINASAAIAGSKLNPVGLSSVGIGTSSPNQLLSLQNTSSQCQQSLTAATNGSCAIYFGDTDSVNRSVIYHHNTGDYLAFYTAASERMRMLSDGRVLIGTTTGAAFSNRQLSVASSTGTTSIELRSATDGDSRILFTDSTSSSDTGAYKGQIMYDQTNDFMSFNTNGNNERLRIASDGRVGINVTNPTSPLHISGGSDNTILQIVSTDAGAFMTALDDTGAGSFGQQGALTVITCDAGASVSDSAISFQIDGNSEKMRIDSAGRIGIGCTPTAQFAHNILQIGNQATLGANAALSTTGQTYLTHNLYFDTSGTLKVFNTSNANEGAIIQLVDGIFKFSNSASTTGTPTVTERMRIDSSGAFLHATTSTSAPNGNGGTLIKSDANGSFIQISKLTTSAVPAMEFYNANGRVGQIIPSGSSTSFTTSSDYRLKENTTAISDGITRLKTLKPYRFNFKATPKVTVDGFFAHEVTAVPEAITGEKDAVNEDGSIDPQGIDQSKLVPLLVAAVQELITKVETLEAA